MTNVLIREVPADVHAELQRRAQARGQSLQQYLSEQLHRLASRPDVADVLDRIDRRRGGRVGLAQAVDDLGAARGDR